MTVLVHTLTKSSGPGAVINAITDRATGFGAGHGPFSLLQSHGQVQRSRSSFQSDCPSCSSTTEQKAQPCAPSVCTFCPDLGFCRGCGPPDCEWPPPCGPCGHGQQWLRLMERGVTAQQRPLLLAAESGWWGLAGGQGEWWWYWLLRLWPYCIWAMIDQWNY